MESIGDCSSSAAGGGPPPGQQAVTRNVPLRRHQPGKTLPSAVRTRSADQVRSGGLNSATVTSTERVSRRSPVPSTLSALSLADQMRFAAASLAGPAAPTSCCSACVR